MQALLKETELQQNYLDGAFIETIYFGGGTPSLLQIADLRLQIEKIKNHFTVNDDAEITLEANPDDISEQNLSGWKQAGINRLSIGVQSFFEEDLRWMNRAHTAQQAMGSLQLATHYFDNITIDLIYGYPLLSDDKWKENVETAVRIKIPHLSCYALTVEPNTPLQKMIREKRTEDTDEGKQSEQFMMLMQWAENAGYEHYEISNFAKPGWRSRHNSACWQGKKYLGIGPSAHSYNGASRQWNVSNNQQYIESINAGIIPFEKEILTPVQRMNEYIMTSLRTMEGLDLEKAGSSVLPEKTRKYIEEGKMIREHDKLVLTREGKLYADGIAADLFFDNI